MGSQRVDGRRADLELVRRDLRGLAVVLREVAGHLVVARLVAGGVGDLPREVRLADGLLLAGGDAAGVGGAEQRGDVAGGHGAADRDGPAVVHQDVVDGVDLHERGLGDRRGRRSVSARQLDRGVGLGAGVGLRIDVRVELGLELQLRRLVGDGLSLQLLLDADHDGAGGADSGSGRVALQRARGARQGSLGRGGGLGRGGQDDVDQDVLLVAHLDDLVSHRDVAADVVETGLDELPVTDVVRVAVLTGLLVEDQHRVVRQAPDEADPKGVLATRVADAGTLLQDDDAGVLDRQLLGPLVRHALLVLLEELGLGRLEDHLGAVGARGVDTHAGGLLELLLGDRDVVVRNLPADLGGAVDDGTGLGVHVGLAVGVVVGRSRDDERGRLLGVATGGCGRGGCHEREHAGDQPDERDQDRAGAELRTHFDPSSGGSCAGGCPRTDVPPEW